MGVWRYWRRRRRRRHSYIVATAESRNGRRSRILLRCHRGIFTAHRDSSAAGTRFFLGYAANYKPPCSSRSRPYRFRPFKRAYTSAHSIKRGLEPKR